MKKKIIALVIDLLIAGLILLVFAYFHHGKRYLEGKKAAAEATTQSYAAEYVVPRYTELNVMILYDDVEEGSVQ